MNLIALILLIVGVYLGSGAIVQAMIHSANDDTVTHRSDPETPHQHVLRTATLIALWPIVLYVFVGETLMDDDAEEDRPTHLDQVSDR